MFDCEHVREDGWLKLELGTDSSMWVKNISKYKLQYNYKPVVLIQTNLLLIIYSLF